ncbi:MAG: SAM hydroxide adenosyltransferase [Planctomycetota bacterium]
MTNRVEGIIAEIGSQGNLITSIKNAQLADAPRDATTSIRFGGHETICLYESGHSEPESTMVAYLGDSECLEIEIVGMNLAGMLGIQVGESVSVVW